MMDNRFTEKYEEWRERVGIMPDQDVREAWEYQQKKIDKLLAHIKTHRGEFTDEPSEKESELWGVWRTDH